jgi:hypothetical protein
MHDDDYSSRYATVFSPTWLLPLRFISVHQTVVCSSKRSRRSSSRTKLSSCFFNSISSLNCRRRRMCCRSGHRDNGVCSGDRKLCAPHSHTLPVSIISDLKRPSIRVDIGSIGMTFSGSPDNLQTLVRFMRTNMYLGRYRRRCMEQRWSKSSRASKIMFEIVPRAPFVCWIFFSSAIHVVLMTWL